ncbi:MAG: hypothetical protein NZ480_08885 [Bdellovibrionaceae bacterium]|nr:hypothetical protein [Pseudobdellovibrionaceae bacterium]MDW8189414.1 hypothetical protein [Pseudobdellovibrionaceae bacterium]
MMGRKPSSNRGVKLPRELLWEIQQTFQSAFKSQLPEEEWFVEGFLYPEEMILSVGFGHPKRLKHHHFMLSWDLEENSTKDVDKDNPQEAQSNTTVIGKRHLQQIFEGVDLINILFTEYLQHADEDPEPPLYWTPLPIPNQLPQCFYQFSSKNNLLEAQANQILGISSHSSFLEGDWDSDLDQEDLNLTEIESKLEQNQDTLH